MNDSRTSLEASAAASATPALLERISWSSVIAGALIALAGLVVLNLIGLGVGLYVIDAEDENLAAGAAATTMGVWWAISSLAALFAGGWIAAKLAGVPSQLIAMLHGLAVWALSTLLAVFMVGSAVSTAFTGAAGLLGRATQAASEVSVSTVDALDPALTWAAGSLQAELQRDGVTVDPQTVRLSAERVFNEAISPAERQRLAALAEQAAVQAVRDPASAQAEFRALAQEAFGPGGVINETDREQAIAALSDELDVSEATVRQSLDRWQAQFVSGGQEFEQQVTVWQAQAAEAANDAAGDVAGTAIWTAVGLILAFAAAAVGGALGRPRTAGTPFLAGVAARR